jgi:biotin operon repressor
MPAFQDHDYSHPTDAEIQESFRKFYQRLRETFDKVDRGFQHLVHDFSSSNRNDWTRLYVRLTNRGIQLGDFTDWEKIPITDLIVIAEEIASLESTADNGLDWIAKLQSSLPPNEKLDQNELAILRTVDRQRTTAANIAEDLGLTVHEVRNRLTKLKTMGLVVSPSGKGYVAVNPKKPKN